MENFIRKFEVTKKLNSRTKIYISEILTPKFLFFFYQGIHYVFALIPLKLEGIQVDVMLVTIFKINKKQKSMKK